MPAKIIKPLFLTIFCMLVMPLVRAHPGHAPAGIDSIPAALAVALLVAVALLLAGGIAWYRLTVVRNSIAAKRK